MGEDGPSRRSAPSGLLTTTTAFRSASVLPLVPAWRVDKTFDYLVPDKLCDDIVPGTLVRIPFGGRVVRGFVMSTSDIDEAAGLEPLKGLVVRVPLLTPSLAEVLSELARRYVVPRGRAFARMVPPRVRTAGTVESGRTQGPAPDRLLRYEGGEALLDALRSRAAGPWCIQALPGEDRGALIAEMVAATPSGQAIVVVPEVRYGSSVLGSLGNIYPELARVDSARSEMERSQAWLSMAAGNRLAGGGRSAVLTPAPDLALIVVDEEHHQTYKENRAPRYDARWVALQRARRHDCLCVFVSASPSVEAGAAMIDGRYGAVAPGRTDRRAARPLVELVEKPEDRSLGPELHERVASTLRSGHRVALLAASAAFARAVWCGECRRSLRCPRCEAGLFFDRSLRQVRCARCDHRSEAPEVCPSCGSTELRYVGAGSERLAEQIALSFPRARVHRVDPAQPDRVPPGPVDIYVTSWMGTKPALRPEVTLVGVLDADWLIRRPDFRSAESAFQALVEMAGWAGPAAAGGRLVVQTAEPNHHALQAVVRADYGFFLRKELELRKELSYPPFVDLVKVSARGEGADATLRGVASALEGLVLRCLGPVDVLGASEEPTSQLLIKCSDARPVAEALRVILEAAPKGTRISCDVDPR